MRYHADDGRIRGSKGVALRARIRREEPLCRICQREGRASLTTEIDHIVPLSMGGTNDRDNLQGLCHDCHEIKTAMEAANGFGAATHPEWLQPSAAPLTILCGPPASGKSTYMAERAGKYDITVDLDAIARSLRPSYEHWHGMMSPDLLSRAIRVRNAMLGRLCRVKQNKAWFIVSAPTKQERDWWHSKLGGEVVLLDPGQAECERRAIARGTPDAIQGIRDWYAKAKKPWQRPGKRRVIGVDGWPVE